MTKTKYWLSLLAISLVLIAGSLAVSPVAIADDDDDDDNDADVVVTETLNLQGAFRGGDFKLLIDTTPVVFDTGHVAMKVPCDADIIVLAGIAPDVAPINMDFVAPLSEPNFPNGCVYHGDIEDDTTDVAILNAGSTVRFGQNPGFTVTVTLVG